MTLRVEAPGVMSAGSRRFHNVYVHDTVGIPLEAAIVFYGPADLASEISRFIEQRRWKVCWSFDEHAEFGRLMGQGRKVIGDRILDGSLDAGFAARKRLSPEPWSGIIDYNVLDFLLFKLPQDWNRNEKRPEARPLLRGTLKGRERIQALHSIEKMLEQDSAGSKDARSTAPEMNGKIAAALRISIDQATRLRREIGARNCGLRFVGRRSK